MRLGWIKLTDVMGGTEMWAKASEILGIAEAAAALGTKVVLGGSAVCFVKETPEEIFAMMAKDDQESFRPRLPGAKP